MLVSLGMNGEPTPNQYAHMTQHKTHTRLQVRKQGPWTRTIYGGPDLGGTAFDPPQAPKFMCYT